MAVYRFSGHKSTKEWTECVESDVRAFGISGDWRRMVLDAGGGSNVYKKGAEIDGRVEEDGEKCGKNPPGEEKGM